MNLDAFIEQITDKLLEYVQRKLAAKISLWFYIVGVMC
jgi:hypothetical protein